jgi:DNA-binding transcriptional regulator YiaG
MPDIATALKEEIRRLARKEIRAQTATTRRAATQHRREIALLKRMILQQDKKIQSLQTSGRKAAATVSTSDELPEGVRFSARSVRAQRKRLKLSAEQFAKLLGVSMQTVYSWEQGRARPRASQLALLVTARSLGRREAQQRLAAIDS